MYFVYDPIVPILCTVVISGYVQDTLDQQYGINVPWWAYSIIVWLGLGVITYLGVVPSIRFSIALTLIEVGITLALSFTVFARHGIHTHDLKEGFTFSGIPGAKAHGLFLAMVFSVLSYTGFEATAPLAEETRDPRRNVARAALIGTALILVYYVIFGFATSVGFGVDKVVSDFPGAANPYYTIANSAWGSAGTIIILIALVNSGWGCSLAGQSAVVRVYYRMAKIGVFPKAFGAAPPEATARRTSPSGCRRRSTSSWASPAASASATLNTFGVGGIMITFGMIFVYGCGLVAVPIFYLREHRDEFRPIVHLILPVLGIVALAPVAYYSVVPFPVWPIKVGPIADIVWFVIGVPRRALARPAPPRRARVERAPDLRGADRAGLAVDRDARHRPRLLLPEPDRAPGHGRTRGDLAAPPAVGRPGVALRRLRRGAGSPTAQA